jgi:hypothetical protein
MEHEVAPHELSVQSRLIDVETRFEVASTASEGDDG